MRLIHGRLRYLESDCLPSNNARAKRILLSEDVYFLDEDNILYHLDLTDKRGSKGRHAQLVLPALLRYEVLVNAHDDLSGGHLGVLKLTRNSATNTIGKACTKMLNIGCALVKIVRCVRSLETNIEHRYYPFQCRPPLRS